MSAFALAVWAQLAAPVLAFPDAALDDTAAYHGYQTRLYRDVARNTIQIYLDRDAGRVVHLWADAENESIGFSLRGASREPVSLQWVGTGADMQRQGRARTVTYDLVAQAPVVQLGAFLLGSMRVERDFQYWGRHRAPLSAPPFQLEETGALLSRLQRVPQTTRREQLALLNATSIGQLRERSRPRLSTTQDGERWVLRVVQPSLDARDTIALELRVNARLVAAQRLGPAVTMRARQGSIVPITVQVSTTGRALTPLAREEIFTPEFLEFLDDAERDDTGSGGVARSRARWMERQVRGVELLSSREKLMAGLPTYATYFGRDMLVTALMMRPVWRDEMSEFAVASALRKLSPTGQVSHEEALGGQAVREASAEYASLVDAWGGARRRGDRQTADSLLHRATTVLREHRRVRENYHMIDDELQLPVLASRWLADPRVSAARKRTFLLDSSDGGGTRLERLLRELALVARMTDAYAASPIAANLISFAPRDSGRWQSSSWRDSGVGYAGGRYAMDVNAIWAPHALAGLERILESLRGLGFAAGDLERLAPGIGTSPLGHYLRDASAVRRAANTWQQASAHFLVRLSPADVAGRVTARLAALPAAERGHWASVLARTGAEHNGLEFLSLSLDAAGQPIGVANTDPATRLFLGEREGAAADADSVTMADALRDVRLFLRPYPAGLFIEGVGPVVANDAYAPPEVWQAFERDRYHGPRVAWGREVNLFLLGVASHLAAAGDTIGDPARRGYARELEDAAAQVAAAVAASGFHSELWSYGFTGGTLAPARYGVGADVQLWSTTDLAVQFALSRLGRRR